MKKVSFEIPGKAAPKGSRTVGFRKDGSVYTREANTRVGQWMKVAKEILEGEPELRPPYRLQVFFVFERPKKGKYEYPVQGDLDKLVRALCDSLQAASVIEDDKFIITIDAEKHYGPVNLTRGTVEEA